MKILILIVCLLLAGCAKSIQDKITIHPEPEPKWVTDIEKDEGFYLANYTDGKIYNAKDCNCICGKDKINLGEGNYEIYFPNK